MLFNQPITKEQAFQKAKSYCSYQERTHKEVKEKLYGFGLRKADVEQLLTDLITEDYLNEERFAVQYAGGKFRMKQWGRKKIQYELKQKGLSAWCINKAMKEIDEADYLKIARKLAISKWKLLQKDHKQNKQAKAYAYLVQKGYEPELANRLIAELKTSSPL